MDTSSPEFQAALRDHAKSLGVDPDKEPQLLGLVQEALLAELPEGWEQGETEDGTLYYFNTTTEESIWEHPLDGHYRELIRVKKSEAPTAAAAATKAPEPAKPVDTATDKKTPTDVAKPTELSKLEVYSFDEDSDDDIKPLGKHTTMSSTTNGSSDKASRLSSLFPQPAPSFSATSAAMTAKKEPAPAGSGGFARASAANGKPAIGRENSSGFGRDRSWLLDNDDDDDIPTLGSFKAPTVLTATAATATTTTKPEPTTMTSETTRPSSSSGMAGGGGSTSRTTASAGLTSSYTSRLFGASGVGGTTTTTTSTAPFTSGAPLSSLDGTITGANANANANAPSGSSTSPTTSGSKISPRRGLASTIKGQIFQEISNPGTASADSSSNAISGATSSAADAMRIKELEKKNAELVKQVEQLTSDLDKSRQQLDLAKQDAKEANYLKMKANEHKTKLTEKETELQRLTQDHAAQVAKFKEEIQQLRGECDKLRNSHDQQASMSQQEAQEVKRTTSSLQSDLSSLQRQHSELQQTLQQSKQDLTRIEQSHRDAVAALERERAEHKVEISAVLEQLEAAKRAHATEISGLKDQIESLRTESREKDRKADSLTVVQDTLDRQTKFLRELEERNKELQSKISETEAKEGRVGREFRQKELECQELERRIANLTADLETRDQSLRDLHERLRSEQQQLKELHGKTFTWQRQEEEFERKRQLLDRERQELQSQLRDKADEIQSLQSQLKKQQEEHVASTSKLQLEVHQLTTQMKSVKLQEVLPLEKERDHLQHTNEKLLEKTLSMEKELRITKQELANESSKNHQLQVEVEAWKRKEQQQKTQKDTYILEKSSLEKQLSNLEGETSAYKHEKRLEIEKLVFRVRELESMVAQKDYEIVRVEERFTKAEAWRLKESRRVEERECQLLDLKEELAQLKSRNIDAENNVIIQELRREKEQLEHRIKQLSQQVEEERVARQVSLQKFQDDVESMQKSLEWQIPQLAAACVNRSSEEWVRKCHQVVKSLRDEFTMKALTERNELMLRIKSVEEARDHVEQKYKNTLAECEFLRKEVHRVEDNNKVLLDQLHTIRVYMTQRSLATPASMAPPPPASSSSPSPSTQPAPIPPHSGVHSMASPFVPTGVGAPFVTTFSDFTTVNQLNAQLGLLHAQFQQLFDATERRAPIPTYSPSERFEIPSSPPAKKSTRTTPNKTRSQVHDHGNDDDVFGDRLSSSSLDRTLDSLLDQSLVEKAQRGAKDLQKEKEELIATLESLGTPQSAAMATQWLPVVSPTSTPTAPPPIISVGGNHPNESMWYQKNYWRTKYQTG